MTRYSKRATLRVAVLGAAALSCLLLSRHALAQVPQNQAAELRSEVARQGSLRLVVTLALDQQQASSEAAIRAKQLELLVAVKGRGKHEVVFLFPSAPMLALVAGPEAVDALLSSPLVAAIMIDSPRRPATELRP